MPIRQRATPLLAFGFTSTNCVKCSGSSDRHSKMVVRIRKDDLARIESNETHAAVGVSQIYVRVAQEESLCIDVGSTININTKKSELSFEVSSIHVLTSIMSQTRFVRTAVLSGRFA